MDETGPNRFESLRCVQCGYLLRGLMMDGKCPECGLGIEESVRGSHLCNSDVEWLKKLYRGSLFLVLGIVGFLLTSVIFTIVMVAIDFDDVPYYRLSTIVMMVVIGGSTLLMFSGLLFLTSREEESYLQQKYNKIRQAARVMAFLTLLSFLDVFLALFFFPVLFRVDWFFPFCLIAFIWSFMLYMSTLAKRAGAGFFLSVTKLIAWGTPILALLLLVVRQLSILNYVFCIAIIGEFLLVILLLIVSLGFLEVFKNILRMHHERFTPEAENRRDESS